MLLLAYHLVFAASLFPTSYKGAGGRKTVCETAWQFITCAVEFFEFAMHNVDNEDAVDVFYLDFRKAFENVPHQ